MWALIIKEQAFPLIRNIPDVLLGLLTGICQLNADALISGKPIGHMTEAVIFRDA